ncbi:hypothetical protein [Rhodospira trueperi]|uniref:Uncharacterized protein n=1 Tax=Rhodospira trueperi TaxID=69960 RepID=A0A1G7D327_9PROT|nr:hypothetical protein [Rhodospira trueperi]SDE46084.1 hypothetical protein SAMN05421720_10719 [Rhodospira trueperi]
MIDIPLYAALGGTRCDDPVVIHEDRGGRLVPVIRGTLAAWRPLSDRRQSWCVRMVGEDPKAPPEAAVIVVEEMPDGRLAYIGGGPLNDAIQAAERTAAGVVTPTSVSDQLMSVSAALVALSLPYHRGEAAAS